MRNRFAVVDLGGQYCHLIARRLRELRMDVDVIQTSKATPKKMSAYAGIILSGGPSSVNESGSPSVDRRILEVDVPVLGICYGHQLMAGSLGGSVEHGESEFGHSQLSVAQPDNPLFKETPSNQDVWMSHSDTVTELPEGFEVLASTPRCANAAFADTSRRLYGLQFHPEVDHSQYGRRLLQNFVFEICNATPVAKPQDVVSRIKRTIRERVKDDRVFFLVSGGVDSTVAFSLVGEALKSPSRVLGLYIDTGLMRKNETEELKANLGLLGLGDRVLVRDESARFLGTLHEVWDPETKRKKIGRAFVEAQADAMTALGIDPDQWLLGQGTIYPDTIESGGTNGKAALIKTHHNRCAEIQKLIERGRVVEPLAQLYKDEVREVGRAIQLSDSLIARWPFPGPGLAIRTLCKPDGPAERGEPESLPAGIAMYEAASFKLRSVGVQGDARTYKDVVALRGRFDYDQMQAVSSYLCNVEHRFNRVIYQLGCVRECALDSGVVLPNRYLTRDRLDVLREADHIARTVLEERNMAGDVWQFPVVLAPLSYGLGESIILRPVNSSNGMTANFARLSEPVIREISDRILRTGLVDSVFLDVTDKPPATIEWE